MAVTTYVEVATESLPGLLPGRSIAISVANERTDATVLVLLAECVQAASTDWIGPAVNRVLGERLGLVLHDFVILSPGRLIKTTSGKLDLFGLTASLFCERYACELPQDADDYFVSATRRRSFETFNVSRGVAITASTISTDIFGWDSLSHTMLIMNIEEAFGVDSSG